MYSGMVFAICMHAHVRLGPSHSHHVVILATIAKGLLVLVSSGLASWRGQVCAHMHRSHAECMFYVSVVWFVFNPMCIAIADSGRGETSG